MVLDAVRQQGQRIWQALSVADRQRFLRHLRHYWDVHRYRVAPQVAEVLEARQRTGSLQVQAARLLSISGEGETLRLTLARRGGGVQTLSVDHLILTTRTPRPDRQPAIFTGPRPPRPDSRRCPRHGPGGGQPFPGSG